MPTWFERLLQDVRHGARVFARSPGFTAIAVLSIACGTGANVAMFSLADALLLRPSPVPRPGELLVVGSRVDLGRSTNTVTSYPDYADIRDRSRSFAGIMAYTIRRAGITSTPGAPARIKLVQLVSGNFFDVLGVQPALGRSFRPEEDRVRGRDAVAILSYGIWQQQYAGDPSVIGRTLGIGGAPFTIVGVLPERFTGLETRTLSQIVYVPLAMAPTLAPVSSAGRSAIRSGDFGPPNPGGGDLLTARDARVLTVRGRLRTGVTIDEARAELTALAANLERAYPATNAKRTLVASTEVEDRLQTSWFDAGLVFLLSIRSTAVLAVACANVAGLLASRTPLRAREISLRLAVGAGRFRLVRQLITESLMLALAGGVCGLAVGYAGIAAIRQIEYPNEIIGLPVIELDQRALLFSLAVAMASAFLFGLGPALHATRLDLAVAMKDGDASPRRRRLAGRTGVVAIQVALSLVLVTVAVSTYQVFRRVATDGPGFHTSQIAKISVDLAYRRYDDRQGVAFVERALSEARALPMVTSATVTSTMPLWGLETASILPEGHRQVAGQPPIQPIVASIGEDYFETMGIPLESGRDFAVTDTAESSRVAIVNETLARHYWPDGNAIGKRFRRAVDDESWVEIVGIARDSKVFYVVEPPQDAVYFPFRQEARGLMVFLARTSGESLAGVGPLRDIVHELDAELPVFEAQTIETFYASRATGFLTVATEMIGGMSLMGMLLTMVGLYGLVSYSVSRRTREIGIRMAIGATYSRILGMILRQGIEPAWIGLPAGLVLSVITARAMTVILPTNTQSDPRMLVAIVPILFAVIVLAALIPARRAAVVDPTVALRHD